mmetsp:Transcript_32685/g.49259  ORF Transcript_32685/g.49259 Transcript_32685/m.49259 type:complete len:121 (+) Transcript_32685:85-447(+)
MKCNKHCGRPETNYLTKGGISRRIARHRSYWNLRSRYHHLSFGSHVVRTKTKARTDPCHHQGSCAVSTSGATSSSIDYSSSLSKNDYDEVSLLNTPVTTIMVNLGIIVHGVIIVQEGHRS